jgi:hypothetical protein
VIRSLTLAALLTLSGCGATALPVIGAVGGILLDASGVVDDGVTAFKSIKGAAKPAPVAAQPTVCPVPTSVVPNT